MEYLFESFFEVTVKNLLVHIISSMEAGFE
jgi:hypothetical protein